MKKEDYNIINDFFNELSLRIFNSENFDKHYFGFIRINDSFIDYMKYYYKINDRFRTSAKKNNMTFEDVLFLSREIIQSISPNYLDMLSNCFLILYKIRRKILKNSNYINYEDHKEEKKVEIYTGDWLDSDEEL